MDKPDANQCLRPHGTSVGLAVKDRYAFRFACRTHAFHLEDAIRRHGTPYRWEYLLSSPPEGEGGGLLGHEGSHDVKGQMLLIEGILEDQGTASAVGAAGDPGNQSAGPKVSFVDTEENLDLRTYFESFLDYMRVGYLGHQKRHTVLVHFVEGAGALLDIRPSSPPSAWKAVSRALGFSESDGIAADWSLVGADIAKAIEGSVRKGTGRNDADPSRT